MSLQSRTVPAVAILLLALAPAAVMPSAGSAAPAASGDSGRKVTDPRAHVLFDDTRGSVKPGVVRGSQAASPLASGGSASAHPSAGARASSTHAEVLGFVQSGEVAGGGWQTDLDFPKLTTIAYFAVNLNGDGSRVTNDYGYQTWWSDQTTQMINKAHGYGDRVVLTVKAFDDPTIRGITGSEQARRTAITGVVDELNYRPADGVNVDFEGSDSGMAAGFVTFISELQSALNSRAPGRNYLTIDTYASAGQGGTMYDLANLWQHVDAIDLMGYGFAPCINGRSGPTAPMGGCYYNVTQAVHDYMARYGVPAARLLLGVPYYGYKWNVTTVTGSGQDPVNTPGDLSADTYAGAVADFGCAQSLQQHWDSTFVEPWASWYSPSAGDPCGGNHGSYRELYYDNADSLASKYDLVNSDGLFGIAIWALGYDSGRSELYAEIAAKFGGTRAPTPQVQALPSTENSTSFDLTWTLPAGSGPADHYTVFAQDSGGPWIQWTTTTRQSVPFFGFPSHSYGFWVQAYTARGVSSPGPASPAEATTSVAAGASNPEPFVSAYAVDDTGTLHPLASPPLLTTAVWPRDLARGITVNASGEGGVVLDAYGGLHPFGNDYAVTTTAYWSGWDITRGVSRAQKGSGGYFADGWGGVHPYSVNGSPAPPNVYLTGYWQGRDLIRGIATFADGSGGVTVDAFGGIHPFEVSGSNPTPANVTGYWSGWDIVRSVALSAGSTSTSYSGYTLDGYGGIHPFSSRGTALPPNRATGAYWPGYDIARAVLFEPGSATAGYVVDSYGGPHGFGGAPGLYAPNYGANDTRSSAAS